MLEALNIVGWNRLYVVQHSIHPVFEDGDYKDHKSSTAETRMIMQRVRIDTISIYIGAKRIIFTAGLVVGLSSAIQVLEPDVRTASAVVLDEVSTFGYVFVARVDYVGFSVNSRIVRIELLNNDGNESIADITTFDPDEIVQIEEQLLQIQGREVSPIAFDDVDF